MNVSDKLWPVLLALAMLLAAAGVLEVVSRKGVLAARVVVIHGNGPAQVSDDDDASSDDGGLTLAASPPLDEDHARARQAGKRGQLDEAMQLYARVVSAHPQAARVHGEMGYFWLAAGQNVRARSELETAAGLASDDAWIAYTLGVARARLGDARAAEKHFRHALELQPQYGAARLALGVALRRRGRSDEAIQVLEPAATTGSNEDRAHVLVALGRAYLSSKRRADAEHAFARAIEFAPADIEVRVGIARAWMGTGRPEDLPSASAELARAAEIAPDVPQVYSALARAREKQGDTAAAAAAYDKALRIDPDYRYARRRLLRLALDHQDLPRARLQADYLLERAPDVPEHHFLAGLVAAHDGRTEEARAHYRDAISKAGGDYPEAYFNLGILEKAAGDLTAAAAAYRKAIELRADYVQAYNNLALVQSAGGDRAGAEATFKQALGIDAHYATGWLNLGELYADLGRRDEAIAAFQQAVAARPTYSQARLDLGVTLARAGRTHEAIATYRELVAVEPRYLAAWFNLGVALEDVGDVSGAADAYHQALAVDGDHVASLRRLSDLEARRGQTSEAAQLYEEVLDRVPDDRDARLALAAQRQRSGDLDGCAHEAHVVLAGSPQDEAATRLFNECSRRR